MHMYLIQRAIKKYLSWTCSNGGEFCAGDAETGGS